MHHNTKHGFHCGGKTHPFFYVWRGMVRRCSSRQDPAFKNYGGRGIKVCKRWLTFANFASDMWQTYRPGLTLERKNNNRGYNPKNCKWATWQEQENNRRDNRRITFDGLTLTLAQWARRLNIKKTTLVNRFGVSGWDIQKSLTRPVGRWV